MKRLALLLLLGCQGPQYADIDVDGFRFEGSKLAFDVTITKASAPFYVIVYERGGAVELLWPLHRHEAVEGSQEVDPSDITERWGRIRPMLDALEMRNRSNLHVIGDRKTDTIKVWVFSSDGTLIADKTRGVPCER